MGPYSNFYQAPNSFVNSRRPVNNSNRFIGGGFLGPFVLGGLTGGLVAPFFYGGYNRPYYQPYYQPYYSGYYRPY